MNCGELKLADRLHSLTGTSSSLYWATADAIFGMGFSAATPRQIVATPQLTTAGLAVDGEWIYWLARHDSNAPYGDLMSRNLATGESLWIATVDHILPEGLAARKSRQVWLDGDTIGWRDQDGRVFWRALSLPAIQNIAFDGDDAFLTSICMSGGTGRYVSKLLRVGFLSGEVSLLTDLPCLTERIALRDGDDFVYVASETLLRVPKKGSAAEVLGGPAGVGGIAVGRHTAFFSKTTGIDSPPAPLTGQIFQVNLESKEVMELCRGEVYPSELFYRPGTLYWVNDAPAGLRAIPLQND